MGKSTKFSPLADARSGNRMIVITLFIATAMYIAFGVVSMIEAEGRRVVHVGGFYTAYTAGTFLFVLIGWFGLEGLAALTKGPQYQQTVGNIVTVLSARSIVLASWAYIFVTQWLFISMYGYNADPAFGITSQWIRYYTLSFATACTCFVSAYITISAVPAYLQDEKQRSD